MKTYKNAIGCTMSFDEGISEEQIQNRLSLFKGEWYEVKL